MGALLGLGTVLRPFLPYIASAAALVGAFWWFHHSGERDATQTIEIEQAREVEKANEAGDKAAAAAAVTGAAGELRQHRY